MLPTSLVGKTAAITGATGSIGFAIATRFAREGASVVLAGRSVQKLQNTLKQTQDIKPWQWQTTTVQQQQQQQQNHAIVELDTRKLSDWKGLVEKHEIDILVNCAGISQHSLLVRAAEADVDKLIDTNLRSAIWGCKVVGKQMISRSRRATDGKGKGKGEGGCCIINVSSLLAQRAVVGSAVYSASKAGLLGLTTALSQEFGHYGVRVNAILPGYIESGMTSDLPDRDEIMAKIPLKRFGEPDEVADAAAFLAKNTYANNCILTLDGGSSAV